MPQYFVSPDRRLSLIYFVFKNHILLVYFLVFILFAHKVQTARPILNQPGHPFILKCISYLVVKSEVLFSNVICAMGKNKEGYFSITVSDDF